MPEPRALIAEDEPVLREELAEMLATLWPELEVVAKVGNGVAALKALGEQRLDVMFLDIQMPALGGLEVARQAAGRCHVAFVTAYDEFAVAAFEEGAVDYVLKPFSAGRMMSTITRLQARLASSPADLSHIVQRLAAAQATGKAYLKWINAARGAAVKLITVDEVAYFRADSKYTLVVTGDGDSLIRKSIKELSAELDPAQFWQIHRSTIVNVNAIEAVTRDLGGHVQVRLKQRKEALAVSESYVHLFRSM